jgi:hypothetical protein
MRNIPIREPLFHLIISSHCTSLAWFNITEKYYVGTKAAHTSVIQQTLVERTGMSRELFYQTIPCSK